MAAPHNQIPVFTDLNALKPPAPVWRSTVYTGPGARKDPPKPKPVKCNLLAVASAGLAILAVAFAIAWWIRGEEVHDGKPSTQTLAAEFEKPQPDVGMILRILQRSTQKLIEENAQIEEWARTAKLTPDDRAVILAFWGSVCIPVPEPSADLLYLAHRSPPAQYANEMLADFYLTVGDTSRARLHYEREGLTPDGKSARKKLVSVLMQARDHQALRKLSSDPALRKLYLPHFTPGTDVLIASAERRWADLVIPMLQIELSVFRPGPILLTTLAGLIWFIITLLALEPPSIKSFRFIAPIVAVFAGVVSAIPTLFVSLWQEEIMHLSRTGDFLDELKFFILGVGPREELMKLLFFLPFVPILLFRKDRLETLLIAGCVGIGFAAEENLHYLSRLGPAAAFGRFLTANFFHLAATALCGLAFVEWLRHPLKELPRFLLTLVAIIVAHGVYDAFMQVKELLVMALASLVSFIFLALQFFQRLRKLRENAVNHGMIAATFLIGVALLTGAIVVYAATQVGFMTALTTLAANALALVMILYLFYWQLNEPDPYKYA